jgi:hypothetical protein
MIGLRVGRIAAVAGAGALLGCGLPPCHARGSVAVDAGVTLDADPQMVCPAISSFSINPALLALGQPAAVSIETVGPDPAIWWSVKPEFGGQFADARAADTTFQCASGGQMTVGVTVGLPDSGDCQGLEFTSYRGQVNCVGSGIVCFPPTYNCGGTCIDIRWDPRNCGGCNILCPTDQACTGGSCVLLGKP